jgi:predicted RNA polymerase sigma factor
MLIVRKGNEIRHVHSSIRVSRETLPLILFVISDWLRTSKIDCDPTNPLDVLIAVSRHIVADQYDEREREREKSNAHRLVKINEEEEDERKENEKKKIE